MARHAPLWTVAATVLGTLVTSTAAPAAQQPVAGGTLDLEQHGGESIVVARNRVAAVALLPGRPDVAAAGEPGASDAAGRVRVVRLKAGQIASASRSSIAGPARGAQAGAALAAVRPLFGRRNAGLLIGAPGARHRAGAAFLVAEPARTRRLRVGDSHAVTILGAEAGDRAGAAVAAVPDVDGDRRPELLIGAPRADAPAGPEAGAAYVVPSRGMRLGDVVDLADRDAALRIDGPLAGARAGSAVAGSRDTDGNGRGEAIVGAPRWGAGGSGAAYVVHLAPGRPVDLAASDAPALALLGAEGEHAGTAVAAPRDLDGDGLDEIVVGAPRALVEGRGEAGAVYVVTPAAAAGAVSLADARARIVGEARGDRLGSELAPAGQAIGSDRPDVLMSAPGSDALARLSAGATYVVSGRAATQGVDLASLNRSGVRLAGGSEGAVTGAALAGDVDVDRDGRDDLLVGARANDSRRPATPLSVLRGVPRLTKLTPSDLRARRCDASATSMVVDTSRGLFDADPEGLRASALQLLVAHPASEDRVIGAVEAAPRPAEVFLPLVPGDLPSKADAGVVDGLIDEAAQRATGAGDLRVALEKAKDLNPSMQSAIVIAGTDALSTGPVPGVRTDVIGVGVAQGSAQESVLRGLAAASGGRYRSVVANELQAQVARFDALRRCETQVKTTFDRYRVTTSQVGSPPGIVLPPGFEIEATATIGDHRHFADLVQSWSSPEETVEPYDLTVREVGGAKTEAVFSSAQVEKALSGTRVLVNGITLVGGAGKTFTALRIGFDREHEETATTARHRHHRINYGGGHSARGAADAARPFRVYTQFFQPPAAP